MAIDAFLKIGQLKGESQDSKHPDWIDVLSFSWGMLNNSTGHMGSGSGGGKGEVQDFHFTKTIDTSSADIAKNLLNGKHFDNATFEIRKAGGDSPVTYYKIEFEKVFITSLSFGGAGGGDKFTESITFSFKKFKSTYSKQKDDGSSEPGTPLGWDISKHEEA